MALLGCTTASEDAITTTSAPVPTEATQSATTTTAATTTATQETTTTTAVVVLDFSQIAGEWSGTGGDTIEGFSMKAEIQPSAELNRTVGTLEYVGEMAISQEGCQISWRALSAEPPVYEVKEHVRAGMCPDGEVTLRYDPETDTIDYEFTADLNPATNATGTLIRVEN